MDNECWKAEIRELCEFHRGPDPDSWSPKQARDLRGKERAGMPSAGRTEWEVEEEVWVGGLVPAPWGQGQRKRMCQER